MNALGSIQLPRGLSARRGAGCMQPFSPARGLHNHARGPTAGPRYPTLRAGKLDEVSLFADTSLLGGPSSDSKAAGKTLAQALDEVPLRTEVRCWTHVGAHNRPRPGLPRCAVLAAS